MDKWTPLGAVACAAIVLVAGGCGSADRPSAREGTGKAAGAPTPAVPADGRSRSRIVVLGDSLTAGFGLEPNQSYPALLQQRVDAAGLHYEVMNAGVTGDTSAGGLRRLDWSLTDDVRVLIVALGANDGLRGLPVDQLRRNLEAIIKRAQSEKIVVILAGMEAPPNFGRSYTDEFRNVYPSLATQHGVLFLPFLLQGVAGIQSLNQPDGIHPTAEGARILADNVWKVLEPALVDLPTSQALSSSLKLRRTAEALGTQ